MVLGVTRGNGSGGSKDRRGKIALAHRMFVTKPRVGTVEGNREGLAHIGFQPVTAGDELFAREVIGIHERSIVSGSAFVVFGDFAIIDLDAMKPVLGFRTCVGPDAG